MQVLLAADHSAFGKTDHTLGLKLFQNVVPGSKRRHTVTMGDSGLTYGLTRGSSLTRYGRVWGEPRAVWNI